MKTRESEDGRTSHHRLPDVHDKLGFIPALSMRFLIPAVSSKPRTVKRNRVTTSWSLGESRSARSLSSCHNCQTIETHGNTLLRRHLLSPWPCLGLCRRGSPQRRSGGSGSSTTAWCTTDMAWMDYLACASEGSCSWIRNRCLRDSMDVHIIIEGSEEDHAHLQKLVTSHLFRMA